MSFFKNSVSSFVFFWLRIANRSFLDLAFWGCKKLQIFLSWQNSSKYKTLHQHLMYLRNSGAIRSFRAVRFLFWTFFWTIWITRYVFEFPLFSWPSFQFWSCERVYINAFTKKMLDDRLRSIRILVIMSTLLQSAWNNSSMLRTKPTTWHTFCWDTLYNYNSFNFQRLPRWLHRRGCSSSSG